MIWNMYPYTDFHNMNQDWIIRVLKEMEKKLENFVATNSIKYANPFQWSIVNQYEKNTLVIEPNSGTAYLSVQAVPQGVNISNTDYWTPVFDLSQLFTVYNDNITFNNENLNIVSSRPYAINSWLIWKNELYLVTSAISIGDALQPGTNIERKSIEDLYNAMYVYIANALSALKIIKPFDTVSDMIAANLSEGDTCKTFGYHNINDGGAASYVIRSVAPSTHYETLSNGLYAELITNGAVNIKTLGAYGDNIHDDAPVLASAIALYDTVYIPCGTYKIDSVVSWNGSKTIFGDGVESLLYGQSIFELSGHGGAFNVIRDLKFDCDTPGTGVTITLGHVEPCVNAIIRDCYFYHSGTAILAHDESDMITIDNCYFYRCESFDIKSDGTSPSYANWSIKNNHMQASGDNHQCISLKKNICPLIENNIMQSPARTNVQHIFMSQCRAPKMIGNYHEILGNDSISNKAYLISECRNVVIDGSCIGGNVNSPSDGYNSIMDFTLCEYVTVTNIQYGAQDANPDYLIYPKRCRHVSFKQSYITSVNVAPTNALYMFDEYLGDDNIMAVNAPVAYNKSKIALNVGDSHTINLRELPNYKSNHAYMLIANDASGPRIGVYILYQSYTEKIGGNAANYAVTVANDIVTFTNNDYNTTNLQLSVVELNSEETTM